MSNPTVTPQLTLDIERKGTTTTVRLHGKLVSGTGDVLYSSVSKLIPESKRIVLDLTELSVMDSMGLGTLVRLYVSARAHGCTVELINIGNRVRELLELTHVWNIFAAVGSMGSGFESGLCHAGDTSKRRFPSGMTRKRCPQANADSLRE